jgi:hypothetical protein
MTKYYKDNLDNLNEFVMESKSFIITTHKEVETVWWKWNGRAVCGEPKGAEIFLINIGDKL